MAAKRPEALSPCFGSFVSPNITDTYYFRWTYRPSFSGDEQTKFQITLMDVNKNVLTTKTVNSSETEILISDLGYNFPPSGTYYWRVTVWNKNNQSATSIDAKFRYSVSTSLESPPQWQDNPQVNDVIRSSVFFDELKSNLIALIDNYRNNYSIPSRIADGLTNKANQLFTKNVVPYKEDFLIIQEILDYLADEEQISPIGNLVSQLNPTLGISDLVLIRSYIDKLVATPPKPVGSVTIQLSPISMYGISSCSATSDGKSDPTINVTWSSQSIPPVEGVINFGSLSSSDDVVYYECTFTYGYEGHYYTTVWYHRHADLVNDPSIEFKMEWDKIWEGGTFRNAMQKITVVTVDKLGNRSSERSAVRAVGENLKVPLGLKQYELQYQRASVQDNDGPSSQDKWYDLYKGTSTAKTHNVANAEGKYYYRVRAVDSSGLVSDWKYSSGVLFDPLDPPPKPKNLSYTSGTNHIEVDWENVKTAERYEWKLGSNGTIYKTTQSRASITSGVSANTTYTIYVRAWNRAGYSDWASIQAKTKQNIFTGQWNSVHSHSYKSDGHWVADQGVWHTYVYQGRWDGGPNYRGIWYFDYKNIRNTIPSNAKILEAKMYITRIKLNSRVAPIIPHFWYHDRDYDYGGYPKIYSPLWEKGYVNKNNAIAAGESKWVKIPTQYIDYIIDGKAKGIAIYNPDGGTYVKFSNKAKLWIKWQYDY